MFEEASDRSLVELPMVSAVINGPELRFLLFQLIAAAGIPHHVSKEGMTVLHGQIEFTSPKCHLYGLQHVDF